MNKYHIQSFTDNLLPAIIHDFCYQFSPSLLSNIATITGRRNYFSLLLFPLPVLGVF